MPLARASAESEAGAPAGLDRWVPSFSIISGITWFDQEASVNSDCTDPGSGAPTRCNPDDPESTSELRPGGEDDDRAVTPNVGGQLQLMTPALRIPGVDVAIPGAPRLFVNGEIPYQFAIERNVASFQNPTKLAEPTFENRPDPEDIPELALLGRGSRTITEIQGLSYAAAAGIAFSFELFGREIRVKPSVGWIRMEIDVEGRVIEGRCIIQNQVPRGQQPRSICDTDGRDPPNTNGFTREITLNDTVSEDFDGIGPGLEIEMDAKRLGPIGVSLFVGGNLYKMLGDREVAFTVSRVIGEPPGTPQNRTLGPPVRYNADFRFEIDEWLYRAGLGVRLHWLGN